MAERLYIFAVLLTVVWMAAGLWLAVIMPTTEAQRHGWRAMYVAVLVVLAIFAGVIRPEKPF